MRYPSKRGSVLVHVLMTGMVVAVIAAGLLRMAMLRYTAGARAASGAAGRAAASASFNQVMTYWNQTNTVCANAPPYSCSPAASTPPGVCGCVCTAGAGAPTITVTDRDATPGPPCNISVQTVDSP